jgi:hypothetical protein
MPKRVSAFGVDDTNKGTEPLTDAERKAVVKANADV